MVHSDHLNRSNSTLIFERVGAEENQLFPQMLRFLAITVVWQWCVTEWTDEGKLFPSFAETGGNGVIVLLLLLVLLLYIL